MYYGILGAIDFILVVWAIIVMVNTPRPMILTLVWLIVIVVLPLIGPILFFLLGRRAFDASM
jgi:hypothetical protein